MTGSWDRAHTPNLTAANHTVESPATPRYNCIGWAAGSDVQWWWPTGRYYWPPNVAREETVDAFIRAYGTLGYVQCDNGAAEDGFEKIVIYGKAEAGHILPTHAARLLPNGRWTSKLGNFEDIEHSCPEDLNCPPYGKPVCYLKRREQNC